MQGQEKVLFLDLSLSEFLVHEVVSAIHEDDLDEETVQGLKLLEDAGFSVRVEVTVFLEPDGSVHSVYPTWSVTSDERLERDLKLIVWDEWRNPAPGFSRVLNRSTRPGVRWQLTTFDTRGEPWGHTDLSSLDHAMKSVGGVQRVVQVNTVDGVYVRSGARASNPTRIRWGYHASPPSEREVIAKQGLLPGTTASYGPPAVYMFRNSDFAENYISVPMDVWKIDLRGTIVHPDPEDPRAAVYTEHPVPPERMAYTGTFLDGEEVEDRELASRRGNPLGNLPAKATRMWEAVYESAQKRGLSKSASAAQAWCAVKRRYYKKGTRWLRRKHPVAPDKQPPGCTPSSRFRQRNSDAMTTFQVSVNPSDRLWINKGKLIQTFDAWHEIRSKNNELWDKGEKVPYSIPEFEAHWHLEYQVYERDGAEATGSYRGPGVVRGGIRGQRAIVAVGDVDAVDSSLVEYRMSADPTPSSVQALEDFKDGVIMGLTPKSRMNRKMSEAWSEGFRLGRQKSPSGRSTTTRNPGLSPSDRDVIDRLALKYLKVAKDRSDAHAASRGADTQELHPTRSFIDGQVAEAGHVFREHAHADYGAEGQIYATAAWARVTEPYVGALVYYDEAVDESPEGEGLSPYADVEDALETYRRIILLQAKEPKFDWLRTHLDDVLGWYDALAVRLRLSAQDEESNSNDVKSIKRRLLR